MTTADMIVELRRSDFRQVGCEVVADRLQAIMTAYGNLKRVTHIEASPTVVSGYLAKLEQTIIGEDP